MTLEMKKYNIIAYALSLEDSQARLLEAQKIFINDVREIGSFLKELVPIVYRVITKRPSASAVREQGEKGLIALHCIRLLKSGNGSRPNFYCKWEPNPPRKTFADSETSLWLAAFQGSAAMCQLLLKNP